MPSKFRILCTGGAGYIGSHTTVHIAETRDWDTTILDNFRNSSKKVRERINKLCKKAIAYENVDLLDADAVNEVFRRTKYDAVIHYAGLKAVNESVEQPLNYYSVNVIGMLNLLNAMAATDCTTLVFSSSATVYAPSKVPLTETSMLKPSNPYGQTKLFIEQILQDLSKSDPRWKISILRYFNPIGAHPSGLIGDSPDQPLNLLPYIQQVAVGRRECLNVFGSDWDTPDGTGVRDYLHVIDLARGHVAAVEFLTNHATGLCAIHNLGTGVGTSVKEMVQLFQKSCNKEIPMRFTDRRPGDLAYVLADPNKALVELNWKTIYTIQDACNSAWKWQSQNPNGYV